LIIVVLSVAVLILHVEAVTQQTQECISVTVALPVEDGLVADIAKALWLDAKHYLLTLL
jgi:hypothetical protein